MRESTYDKIISNFKDKYTKCYFYKRHGLCYIKINNSYEMVTDFKGRTHVYNFSTKLKGRVKIQLGKFFLNKIIEDKPEMIELKLSTKEMKESVEYLHLNNSELLYSESNKSLFEFRKELNDKPKTSRFKRL